LEKKEITSTQAKKGPEGKNTLIKLNNNGDSGQTRLLSGEKVSKSSLRIEACGNLDEASAAMGLAKAYTDNQEIRGIISTVQKELVIVAAELASTDQRTNAKRIEPEQVSQLEQWIAHLQEEAPLEHCFIEPGANVLSATLDLARTIIRRTERSMVSLQEAGQLERAVVLKYINRLSCLFYTLARYAEKLS
jgi:cob(I)alamin adenosyltransferase